MSITLILIIIISLVSIYAWQNDSLTGKWIFNPYTINRYNQYYRFLTSGFLHGSWIHLFFNMFVLYMFGRHIEAIFYQIHGLLGLVLYVALFLLGVIVSNIPTYIKYKSAPHYNALGASGGVSSILFSFILFDPISKLYLYGIIGLPGIVWAALYIIYSYYMGKKGVDNINHDAHLVGGIFGIVFTILIYPNVINIFIEQLKDFRLF